MKTYEEVIARMVKNEAFKMAVNQTRPSSTTYYPGIDMVSFVYDVTQNQVAKDVKAGLTPEALKLGKQTHKNIRSKL